MASSDTIMDSKSPRKGGTFQEPMGSFEVLVQRSIGEVVIDPYGNNGLSPREAAFLLICREGEAGEYQFPNEDGSTVFVTVEYQKEV